MLADSNLIIYAASGNYPKLLNWFLDHEVSVSAISLVEALGYRNLKPREKSALENIFSELTILYPTPKIFQTAVALRQQRTLSLGDTLIAATALNHGLVLATHNKTDFEWIKPLKVVDPLEG